MVERCGAADVAEIVEIINEAAERYRGVIPADCWHEPYMSRAQLEREIAAGVEFWGWYADGRLCGVMGLQEVRDVTLIRHAYVRSRFQGQGIGGRLLQHLLRGATKPVLIGTWADAAWAIRFYERHGFRVVPEQNKDRLLDTYWTISPRQRETSVVLAQAEP